MILILACTIASPTRAREVSSVPSRSKEHDTTVFVCDYMQTQTSVTIWIQQAYPVCPFPRPVSLPVLAPVHTVKASEPPFSLLRPVTPKET